MRIDASSLLSELEFHEVVSGIALVDVSPDDRVIFQSWVAILWLVLNTVEACFVTCLEHQVVWDVVNIDWVFRGCIKEKVKRLKVFWRSIAFGLGIHSSPKVMTSVFHPPKLSDEHVPIILNAFFDLR